MILIFGESMEEVRDGEGVMSKFRTQTAAPAVRHWASHIENLNVLSDIDNSLSNQCVSCCLFCEKTHLIIQAKY